MFKDYVCGLKILRFVERNGQSVYIYRFGFAVGGFR